MSYLYDIRIIALDQHGNLRSVSSLMLTELFGKSPRRDAVDYWTSPAGDANEVVQDHWDMNGWDIAASYPDGYVAEWAEVYP